MSITAYKQPCRHCGYEMEYDSMRPLDVYHCGGCGKRLPYPHPIQRSFTVTWSYWKDHKDEINREVKKTDTVAFAAAKALGIARPSVRGRYYDLHYICDFTDRPMYLMGPNAPKITSFKTAFAADCRDNPEASYSISIDDQDYLDWHDELWMRGLVEQAKKKGLASLRENWAQNVIDKVKKRMKNEKIRS